MTPCEKLGYKVGDRFEVVKSGGFHHFEIGQNISLIEDDGTETPNFQAECKTDTQWVDLEDVKPINRVAADTPSTPQNPIEYLKSAHADGDMIDPATMLRECFGITKTERVVVEWSEVTKREIKVGDKVRLLRGGDEFPLNGYANGGIYTVQGTNHRGDIELSGGKVSQGYAHPSSVEPV